MSVPEIPNGGAHEALIALNEVDACVAYDELNDCDAHDADKAVELFCGGDHEALIAKLELIDWLAHDAETAVDAFKAKEAVVELNELDANDDDSVNNEADAQDDDIEKLLGIGGAHEALIDWLAKLELTDQIDCDAQDAETAFGFALVA